MANIKDIAILAGVSVATVSRAMRNPELVRPETARKVVKAVDQLDYRPNAMARSLRRRRSDTIIVVVPSIHNPFFSGVVQGIENIAHANGYKILLGETQNNQIRLDRYTDMLMSKEADGLILLGSLLPTVVRQNMERRQRQDVPLVLACERFKGLNSPSVEIDNVAAAKLATAHLLDQGLKAIATIAGPADNPLSQDRLAGFKKALAEANLRDHGVEEGDFGIESGYAAMNRLLARRSRPTGVFCANDEMALGALKALRDAGLHAPDQVAVVGFDNIRFGEYCTPTLTTIAQPTVEIGEVAMELMLRLLASPNKPGRHVTLPHQLLVRESSVGTQRRTAEAPRVTQAIC